MCSHFWLTLSLLSLFASTKCTLAISFRARDQILEISDSMCIDYIDRWECTKWDRKKESLLKDKDLSRGNREWCKLLKTPLVFTRTSLNKAKAKSKVTEIVWFWFLNSRFTIILRKATGQIMPQNILHQRKISEHLPRVLLKLYAKRPNASGWLLLLMDGKFLVLFFFRSKPVFCHFRKKSSKQCGTNNPVVKLCFHFFFTDVHNFQHYFSN